jgi:pimeloyl-ACP methyl ester carboxylesterase
VVVLSASRPAVTITRLSFYYRTESAATKEPSKRRAGAVIDHRDAPTGVGVEPAWFADACARAPKTGEVVVGNCPVRFLSWQPDTVTAAPLLLLHGSTAHAHWWSHLAPILAVDRAVAAMDISGHGDSGHRRVYTLELWTDEMLAVARAVDPDEGGLFVVGHSLGGHIATVAAARGEHPLAGVIQCDTVVERPEHDPREGPTAGGRRYYPTLADALAHFRLTPPQPESLPFIVDRVARRSLSKHASGWRWKFDPGFMTASPRSHSAVIDVVSRVPCPIACIYAEHGLVSRDAAERLAAAARRPVPTVMLAASGHHPMLDHPLALVAAIRGIIATWEATDRSHTG